MENNEVWTNEDQMNLEKDIKKNEMNLFKASLVIGGAVIVGKIIYKKAIQPKINKLIDRAVEQRLNETQKNQDQQSNGNSN